MQGTKRESEINPKEYLISRIDRTHSTQQGPALVVEQKEKTL